MEDKRTGRTQPAKRTDHYFQQNVHKSMFLNELQITIPKYYVVSWGEEIISKHNEDNRRWNVKIDYRRPGEKKKKEKFNATLYLSNIKKRTKESSYRLKWDREFAIRLAKDYPKSFIRSLEFHIGDEHYKKMNYSEYDIGGFKEELQVKISWINDVPKVDIKELFHIKPEYQGFPNVFEELGSYFIADYLLSSEQKLLRSIQVTKWKKRESLSRELNENNIYLLLNRSKKQIYFGETKKSMSERYPAKHKHHSFPEWKEYSIIHLPPETTNATRLLIEKVLIRVGCKLFPNVISNETPILDKHIQLMNKK